MVWVESGESGAFPFSRRDPDFCDGRRSFLTNENSNLYRQGRRRWISLITNPLNCWAPVPQSHINMASLGQTSSDYPIYRQKVKSPIVWDFPYIWKPGFMTKAELRSACIARQNYKLASLSSFFQLAGTFVFPDTKRKKEFTRGQVKDHLI